MFRIVASDGAARAGELTTRSGTVATPFFMPVITQGIAARVIGPPDYHRLGLSAADHDATAGGVAIANSLIAGFTPGAAAIAAAGGLARWLDTKSVLFTDSGGYQTSQGSSFVVQRTHDGYRFAARWSEASLHLTPERAIELQQELRSDVAMVLDDVAPHGCDRATLLAAIERTHAWAERALRHRADTGQLLFGISQGGIDPVLREQSAAIIDSMGFDGAAIGGVAILPTAHERMTAVRASICALRPERPRYVMGVSDPGQIVRMVGLGVDCFDAAYPSIQARAGMLLTDDGFVRVRDGSTEVGEDRVRALARHNAKYLAELTARIRAAIGQGSYQEFAQQFCARWEARRAPSSPPNELPLTLQT
jgi:queuine tRNA-ribosyltransferase